MPAHLSHDPQCENVHFVGSYFLEHLGILKYDGTVAGGWARGWERSAIVSHCLVTSSTLIHARQTSHNMGTGDLTFVIIKTLFYSRYM